MRPFSGASLAAGWMKSKESQALRATSPGSISGGSSPLGTKNHWVTSFQLPARPMHAHNVPSDGSCPFHCGTSGPGCGSIGNA